MVEKIYGRRWSLFLLVRFDASVSKSHVKWPALNKLGSSSAFEVAGERFLVTPVKNKKIPVQRA